MWPALPILLGVGFFGSGLTLAWRRQASRTANARRVDGGSLRLLGRVIGAAVVVGTLLSAFGVGPRLPGGFPWPPTSLAVFAAGTVLRWWAIWHLGRFFTVDVAVASDHRVVNTGPYRWVRHPSYTGLLMQFTGLALAMNNLYSLLMILLPTAWALGHRIAVEEKVLGEALGKAYLDYSKTVKRLVPFLY